MPINTSADVWARLAACLVTVFLSLCMVGCPKSAEQPAVTVAVSMDIPPYIIDSATSGIEIDLMREALPGTPMVFVQMSYEELQSAIEDGRADIAVGVQKFGDDKAVYSNEFVGFQNAAIVKKSAGLKIDSVTDLAGHKVLTWQDAYRELGPEFEKLFSPDSPYRGGYTEFANQAEQVRAFWAADADVIVIDRSIFQYFTMQAERSVGEVDYHEIFPTVTEFYAGFKEAYLRNTFDRTLAEMCKSGRYAGVLKKYHVELPQTVCDR